MGALRYSVTVLAGLTLIAAIFSIAGGPMAKFMSNVQTFMSRPRPTPQPVDRPTPQAEAALANLRTAPLLQALPADPVFCDHVRKYALDRCHYQTGDVRVMVSWPRHAVDSIRLSLEKRMPRNVAPFAWADLANTLPSLCRATTAERAEEVLHELADRMLRAHPYFGGPPVQDAPSGAIRQVTMEVTPQCSLYLSERLDGDAVRATVEAMPWGLRAN
jgi:hypothetical protein